VGNATKFCQAQPQLVEVDVPIATLGSAARVARRRGEQGIVTEAQTLVISAAICVQIVVGIALRLQLLRALQVPFRTQPPQSHAVLREVTLRLHHHLKTQKKLRKNRQRRVCARMILLGKTRREMDVMFMPSTLHKASFLSSRHVIMETEVLVLLARGHVGDANLQQQQHHPRLHQ
jgi:hypothetical protein